VRQSPLVFDGDVDVRDAVQVPPAAAGADHRGGGRRIEVDLLEPTDVDHHATVYKGGLRHLAWRTMAFSYLVR
jgi:hypothetical protein